MAVFEFTDEQKMLRETARDFCNSEIKPRAQQIDQEEKIPDDIIAKLRELGFLGVVFPPEYGGSGFGETGYCLM